MGTNTVKYNIITIGDCAVGKTSIINRFIENKYANTTSTIGVSVNFKDIKFLDTDIRLNTWDTGGSEMYQSLTNNYYRNVDGIFIVYDTTNLKSLFNLNNWMEDIKNYAPEDAVKILIGSKCENQTHRQITTEEGQLIAKHLGISFFEVSSKDNLNIDEVFSEMVSKIYMKYKTLDASSAVAIRLVNTDSVAEPSSKCCS